MLNDLNYPKDGDPEKYSNCDIAEIATKKERIPAKLIKKSDHNSKSCLVRQETSVLKTRTSHCTSLDECRRVTRQM